MKSYYQKIEDYLECNGWSLESLDSDHNDWWADEFWLLKSTWSPVGSSCYLTYLVDPMFEGNRKRREGVWAVGVSRNKPLDQLQAQSAGTIALNRQFKENIESFLENMEDLRAK